MFSLDSILSWSEEMIEMQSRTFNTSTLAGLKQAELYQQHLYSKFDKVVVMPVGMSSVKIWGELRKQA